MKPNVLVFIYQGGWEYLPRMNEEKETFDVFKERELEGVDGVDYSYRGIEHGRS